jgi:hypothetical protein
MGRYLYRLVGLALLITLGIRFEARAGHEAIWPDEPARCSGEYAPGIVLVGLGASAACSERLPLTADKTHLRALLQEAGWGEGQFGTPRQILSNETSTVHALPVAVGQECAALETLRRHPAVAFAELDYIVHATDVITPDDPGWVDQWGPARISAPTAWGVTTGTPDVVVAVVDTGVELDHEDLVDNLWTNPGETPGNGLDDDGNGKVDDLHGWHFWHFYDGGTYLPKEDGDVADDHGHGTHVAGIAAAEINNGVGIAGVAGNSRMMVVKVLDQDGDGYYSDLAQGIVYAVDNGARIINLSLGAPDPSEALQVAIDYAYARGAVLVAASGNDGTEVLYPAAAEHVLAVAATDPGDEWAPFSNHGPEVDVAAPGTHIYSTGWSGVCPGRYCYMQGTSMATPHVAGLAALMRSVRPDLASVQVTQAITSTVLDVNEHIWPGRDEYIGWGRIEAAGAISTALSFPVNEYDVEMTPPTAAMTATVGSLTTYMLAVRNTGNYRDAFQVELGSNAWETIPSTDLVGPVDPDIISTLEITVAIPLAAWGGVTDTVDVVVTSIGDRSRSVTTTLATTAIGQASFLPIIRHSR